MRPSLSIVVIAGNHDAAGRLEAPRPLLATIGTRVVGNVRRRDGRFDAAHHLVGLPNRRGETAAQVLALSYPTAACLPPLAQFDGDVALATAALYAEAMAASASLRQGLPLIVTGHLHVAGGLESEGSERRILVGGQHARHRQASDQVTTGYGCDLDVGGRHLLGCHGNLTLLAMGVLGLGGFALGLGRCCRRG